MAAMSITAPELTKGPILLFLDPDRKARLETFIQRLRESFDVPIYLVQSSEDLRHRLQLATHSCLIIDASIFSPSLWDITKEFSIPTLLILNTEHQDTVIDQLLQSHPFLIDFIDIHDAESPALHRRLHHLLHSYQQWTQLKQKSEEYELFFSLAQEGIWFVRSAEPIPTDADVHTQVEMMFQYGYFAYCNQTFAQMYGYHSPAEVLGKPLSDFLIPDDPNNRAFLEAFVLSGYQLRGVESHEQDKEGNDKYFSNSLIGMVENGYLMGAWGTQLDITEQRLLERQLRETLEFSQFLTSLSTALLETPSLTELYPKLVDILHQGLHSSYTGLLLRKANNTNTFVCMAKQGFDDIESSLFTEFSIDDPPTEIQRYTPKSPDLPAFARHVFTHLETDVLYALPLWHQAQCIGLCMFGYRRTDTVLPDIFSALSHVAHILSFGIAHRQLEEQFRQQKQQWATLVQNAPIAITRFLLEEDRYEFANAEFERQAGCTLEEFEQLSDQQLIEMIHPEDRQRVFEFYRDWREQGFPGVQRIDYRIINRQGKELWLDTFLYAEFDENQKPYAIVQLCTDITELRKAQSALQRAMQEEFRQTIQNVEGIIARLRRTADGRIEYVLREGQLAGELTTEKVQGKTPHEVFEDQCYADSIIQALVPVFDTGEPFTTELKHQDKILLSVARPIFGPDGSVTEVVASVLDITKLKAFEQELETSRHRYQRLIEALPAGILIMRVQYQPIASENSKPRYQTIQMEELYVNPAFAQTTGYTLEEFQALRGTELVHPDDFERVIQQWFPWLEDPTDQSIYTNSYRIRHKSGEYRWIELYAVKLETPDPLVFDIVQVGIDITDRKRAEERLSHLASFPEQNVDPIIEVSLEGQVLYCNPAAETQFPDLRKQGLQHPILQGLEKIQEELKRFTQRPYMREVHFQDHIYEERIFFIPEIEGLRIYCYDVTLARLSEQRLRETLEREQEFSRLRSRFIRLLSHEVRTPLTGILSSADMIRRYFHRLPEEQKVRLIETIIERSKELGKLMDDFSFYNSLYEIQLREQFSDTIEVEDFLMHVQSTFDGFARGKQQQLKIEVAPEVPAIFQHNRMLLDYVVRVLLQNACRFSPPHATIWFRLAVKNSSRLIIEVEDPGVGIPEKEQHNLFQPFFRGSNVAHLPGTGLGLALLREFVELAEGSITIQSKENVGTKVQIELPFRVLPTYNGKR